MTEQAEPSVVALRARRSALASRRGATADADRVLAQVLADAHAARREGIRRLDAIAEGKQDLSGPDDPADLH